MARRSSPKVRIGSDLQTKVDPRVNNGESVAAAKVTRVVETDEDQRVNLRVFLDTGFDQRNTNVKLVDSQPEDDDEDVETDVSGTQRVAWFPVD